MQWRVMTTFGIDDGRIHFYNAIIDRLCTIAVHVEEKVLRIITITINIVYRDVDIVGAGEIVAHERSNRVPNHINTDVDKTIGHHRSRSFSHTFRNQANMLCDSYNEFALFSILFFFFF